MIGPRILMYHSVADHPADPYAVSVDAFREQIGWLSSKGFGFIELSRLVRAIRESDRDFLCKKVVITFDDGYEDFLINALPILLEHRAPATVFLVTGMLGGRATWNPEGAAQRLMTGEEVRYIKRMGIGLGGHTVTHANLLQLNRPELLRQLRDARDCLIDLGEDFHSFAYPWGQRSDLVMQAVSSSGYECAVAVGEKTRMATADLYALPRVAMRQSLDRKCFRTLMTRSRLSVEIRRRYGALLRAKKRTQAWIASLAGPARPHEGSPRI